MDFPQQEDTLLWFQSTVVPAGVLLILSMEGAEALNQVFDYRLELRCLRPPLDLSALLGNPATVMLKVGEGVNRYFHGIITEFELVRASDAEAIYRARMQPWFWLLSRSGNCRIFQNQSVPDIIKAVFRGHGFSDFEEVLFDEYETKDYVVQYHETDFDFVSRLLEQEGIHYYFRHDEEKHTLILDDGGGEHPLAYESLPYYPPDRQRWAEDETIDDWAVRRQICSGSYATTDYDFESPSAQLSSNERMGGGHPHSDLEVYEYPGGYTKPASGRRYAKIRAEQLHAPFEVATGHTNARRIQTGYRFTLEKHPIDDLNREYVVRSAAYKIRGHELRSTTATTSEVFECAFTASDSTSSLRPPLRTKRPRIEGPQTAVVVGKKGEEIWTDKHGRVLVKFHWDRDSKGDENSSCWVRVSQGWAGPNWGMQNIPRIDEEVIVEFLEGDPDRPIITGRVYNGFNMPPYTLPQNRTQTGIKSRSSKNGGMNNFNEIRLEDKKGEEELFIQAEKNQTTNVKANQTITVGGDRSVSVTGNQSVTISGKGRSPVHSKLDVTGKHGVHASDTIEMDAPTHIKLTCGGSSILIEPDKITIEAGGGSKMVLDANAFIEASGKASVLFDANMLAKSSAGSQVLLDANACTTSSGGSTVLLDSNVLASSSGNSQVLLDGNATMATNGDVLLGGMNVSGLGKVEVTMAVGGSGVQVTAAGTTASGPATTIAGQATVTIAAPMIKIG